MTALTPLAYFAAHAPAEIPSWFQPTMAMEKPPQAPFAPNATGVRAVFIAGHEIVGRITIPVDAGLAGICSGSMTAEAFLQEWTIRVEEPTAVQQHRVQEFDKACAVWREARDKAIQAQIAWSMDYNRECLAQWPWYWATCVLKCAQASKIMVQTDQENAVEIFPSPVVLAPSPEA